MNLQRLLWSCLLISSASLASAAPYLEGSVTDEQGQPIAGASVKVWSCLGTCLGGTTVLTDTKGHYAFVDKPFQNSPLLTIDLPGRYEVSREQTGPKLEDEKSAEPRIANFVLGTPAA